MRELLLQVDPSLGRRAGLERAIRDAIGAGRLPAGAALPSTRALAADLGLSRATVVAAYEQLVAEGFLLAKQGAGTRVAPVRLAAPAREAERGLGPSFHHDFRPGAPDVGMFPRAAWLRSVRRVLRRADDGLFDYSDPRGRAELRTSLAAYLGRARAVSAEPGSIGIFGGFFSAIGFVAEALRDVGVTRVAIEDPSLFAVRDVLRLAGVEPVGVPVDGDGIDVSALERQRVGAVVVTPSHQYPLGMPMAPARRSALVDWARDRGAWIIEDDYDGEFRYDRRPIGALQSLAPDRVVYAGTTSKMLAPGLRLSWLVIPPGLEREVRRVTHLRAGVSAIAQVALSDFIERGELDRHLRGARGVYRQRRSVLIDRLAAVDGLRVVGSRSGPSAGLHITVEFTGAMGRPLDEVTVIAKAADRSLGLLGLEPHWLGPATVRGLVIGFSRPPGHRFAEGLDQLVTLLENPGER